MIFPIGIVRISIESLLFDTLLFDSEVVPRQLDQNHVSHLVDVFTESNYGCDRTNDKNYIPAVISHGDLTTLLHNTHISERHLSLTLADATFRPEIVTNHLLIPCLHGKHRIAAAKQFCHPNDLWWTIELFIKEQSRWISFKCLTEETEYVKHLNLKLSFGKKLKVSPTRQSLLMEKSIARFDITKLMGTQLWKRNGRCDSQNQNPIS